MIKKLCLMSATALLLSACNLQDNSHSSTVDNNVEPSPSWPPSAGNATLEFNAEFPFLQFIPNLDLAQLNKASQGRELFIAEWTAAPGTRPLLDGLGPLTITSACSNCHFVSGRTPSLQDNNEVGVGLLFRLADSQGNPDPFYGGQLQTAATAGNSEGRVSWALDDKNKPIFTLTTHQVELTEGINLGPRLSPQLVGIGLLDLVSDAEIISREDEHDANNDGISGRAHWRTINGEKMLGRFGWKAMQPSLEHQSAGALQQDMGLTTRLNPNEPCTELQTICATQPNGGSPEVSDSALAAINNFLTLLAVPERRIHDQHEFNRGAEIFSNIGCDACHQPVLKTGDSNEYPLLAHQTIYAYTDLLLHDLGEDLNDNVKEGNANPNEWRTPPLWSLGLIEAVEGSRFLHDGRAETIEDAIIWHGGEALNAKNRFSALNSEDKKHLLSFLRSI